MSDEPNAPRRGDEEDGARVGFDRLRVDDVIHQQFSEERIGFAPNPLDDLPSPVLDQRQAFAPPLALETFVCLADERQFVRRDRDGYITRTFEPDEVEQTPSGPWRVKADHMHCEPVRRQCQHLCRQLTDFSGDTGEVMMERCCTARRDSGGEFLSLRDVQMVACEHRSPRDVVSDDRLRKYDERKLKQGAARRAQGEGFNLAKIEHEPDADLDGVIE